MNEPTLHPNLAKLAASYDEILERLSRGQISAVAARAEIAQLETRDDQGVRWSIDPDSGEWVRKTALGDFEYDAAPPTYGYMTPDAFDYTQQPQVFNPADRLQLAAVTEQLEQPPTSLLGATRAKVAGHRALPVQVLLSRATAAPARTKAASAALVVVLLATALYSCSGPGEDAETVTPDSTISQVEEPAPAPATAPIKKRTKKPGRARPAKKRRR